MLWATQISSYLKLTDGQSLEYGSTAVTLMFSNGMVRLTSAIDLVSSSAPFIIALETEDATNPAKCLKSDGTYGACTTGNDTFYVDPGRQAHIHPARVTRIETK